MLMRGTTHEDLDWADAVPYVLKIYNGSRHEGLGMPPFEALTGRRARHPQVADDFVRLFPRAAPDMPGARSTLRPQLLERFGSASALQDAWAAADASWLTYLRAHMDRASGAALHKKEVQHAQANRNRVKPVFKPGMQVMIKDIHKPLGTDGKLLASRTGPWEIVQVHPDSCSLEVCDAQGDVLPRHVPFDHVRLIPSP